MFVRFDKEKDDYVLNDSSVDLLSYTSFPEDICTLAARTCYSDDEKLKGLYEDYISCDTEDINILKNTLSSGHHSVVEHASFTFLLKGVSRALTHQLVRHRIASFSQQSQRYTTFDRRTYVIPDSILNDETEWAEENGPSWSDMHWTTKRVYDDAMAHIWGVYRTLIKHGVPPEDARYVLPNACTTNIVVTMNARELLHFFNLRCCNRAQWEIRSAAIKMLDLCKKVAPAIFESAGPSCITGPCPEGKKSCGQHKGKGFNSLND